MNPSLPVYAFDFDKTLTLEDSTLPFLLFETSGWERLKRRLHYYSTAVLVKGKLWSTAQHKQHWLGHYFGGWSEASWQNRCAAFASSFPLHPLYKEVDWKRPDRVHIVLTASPVDWVRPFFPAEVLVFGSELTFGRSGLQGLAHELSGAAKLKPLHEMGIEQLEVFYTDHPSDRPVALLAKQLFVVKGKEVIHCADMRSFDRILGIK
jgi:hypothetical protein